MKTQRSGGAADPSIEGLADRGRCDLFHALLAEFLAAFRCLVQ